MDLINTFNSLRTPDELFDFMNKNIDYGFIGNDNKIYNDSSSDEWENACRTKWRLADYKTMLKCKTGHCFDQTELEREWFRRNNYEYKTIYIYFKTDISYPCHTYLVYKNKDNDKWCWFEHSDYSNRGIHEYDSLVETISAQMLKHIEYARCLNLDINDEIINCIRIYQYEDVNYGCSYNEFLDNIINNSREITDAINYKT